MKLALCVGRGEIVKTCDIKYSSFDILLIKPQSGLSTKEVYKAYKYDGSNKEYKIKNILKALENNNFDLLEENIFNDLTIPALGLNEELNDIYNYLKEVSNIHLSGSGPTMFIINPTKENIDLVNQKYKDCFICLCKTI